MAGGERVERGPATASSRTPCVLVCVVWCAWPQPQPVSAISLLRVITSLPFVNVCQETDLWETEEVEEDEVRLG